MSKSEKLYKRLFSNNPPTDFTWEELITVMRRIGFKESCCGGSHYIFEHISGYRFSISKTHPSGILKKYQVKAAKEAINSVGQKEGENNEQ